MQKIEDKSLTRGNLVRVVATLACIIFFGSTACKPKPKAVPGSETSRAQQPAPIAATTSPPPVQNQIQKTQPGAGPRLEVENLARDVGPAVILVSVFDSSGQLLRKGTGFFISDNGRLVTCARLIEGGENAIATAANGKIYNITGILATSSSLDLAVMKADAKRVSFLPFNKTAAPEPGTSVAVIGSPVAQKTGPALEATISEDRSRPNGDWFDLTPALTKDNIGSPVVNGKSEVVGIVTSARGPADTPVAVRTSVTQSPLLASFPPEEPGRWPGAAGPTPSPSPTPTAKPKVVKLVAAAPGAPKLIYTPQPIYPVGPRLSRPPLAASGLFRVTFVATGEANSVQVVQSTGSPLLDAAAGKALRRWKSSPGREWSTNVPITFGR